MVKKDKKQKEEKKSYWMSTEYEDGEGIYVWLDKNTAKKNKRNGIVETFSLMFEKPLYHCSHYAKGQPPKRCTGLRIEEQDDGYLKFIRTGEGCDVIDSKEQRHPTPQIKRNYTIILEDGRKKIWSLGKKNDEELKETIQKNIEDVDCLKCIFEVNMIINNLGHREMFFDIVDDKNQYELNPEEERKQEEYLEKREQSRKFFDLEDGQSTLDDEPTPQKPQKLGGGSKLGGNNKGTDAEIEKLRKKFESDIRESVENYEEFNEDGQLIIPKDRIMHDLNSVDEYRELGQSKLFKMIEGFRDGDNVVVTL